MFRFERKLLGVDVAVTNGCEDQDPNSSKGLVARLGADGISWACGFSVKVQDGIGSENQKYYKNHVGVDSMLRFGYLTLSTEAIHDEYGFRRPGFDPLDITWERSIYYRDTPHSRRGMIGAAKNHPCSSTVAAGKVLAFGKVCRVFIKPYGSHTDS